MIFRNIKEPSWVTQNLIALPFLLVAAGVAMIYLISGDLPVHELVESRAEPEIIRPDVNGNLKVRLITTSVRRIVCPTDIYRTFSRADTGEEVYRLVNIGGSVPPTGKQTPYPFEFIAPPEKFPDGDYVYNALAIDRCADGKTFVVPGKPTKFRVERGGDITSGTR